jgi:peptide/nickel transport system permease protein
LKKPLGKISFTFILILFVSAIFANFAAPSDPNEIDTANIFSKPSLEHLFGADDLGRDVLSRVMHGGRISLIIAFFASAIAMIIGVLWGFLAAQIGGWVDDVLMRTVDALLSIPIILLALILVAALGTNVAVLAVIIGVILAPATARLARSAVIGELQLDYSQAATVVGASRLRILFSEVLPNTAPVLMARAVICVADTIIIEASLSFVGLGINPPDASWGSLTRTGYEQLFNGYWLVLAPGLVILLAIWSFNTFSDQILEALDPRSGK